MKTLKPLAAALFLLASPAAAQLLTGPSGGGLNFGGTGSLASQAAPITDFTFRCGTPPWKACTDVEMNQRQPILMARQCPSPVTAACTDFLMRELGGGNPAETIAAYDPPPGRQWASPDCQRIPCRLAEPADEIVVTGRRQPAPTESGLPYDQQPGFIGPPAPSSNQGPQPFTDGNSFQRAMQEQEALTPGKVVDLGNNTYAVDTGDGNYSIGGLCGRSPCSGLPKPADQIPGLSDALQAANSLNSGAGSINNGNKNAFGTNSAPNPPGGNGRSSQGTEDVASSSSDEAQSSGGDAGSFFRSNGGGAAAGGSSGGSYAASSANDREEVIATKAAALDGVFTYVKTQEIKAAIEKTAGAVTSDGNGTFVTPNTAPDANAGDLQFKGTQSGSNR